MWIAILAIILLDQLTKYLVLTSMDLYQSIPVFGDALRLTYIRNAGGAFGLRWGHVAVYYVSAAIVVGWIGWHLWRDGYTRRLSLWSLVLILGGAIGNLIDRLMHGEVIDFIDAEFFDLRVPAFDIGILHHPGLNLDRWPTFNVADSAVTIGVTLLVISLFWDPVVGHVGSSIPADVEPNTSPTAAENGATPVDQHHAIGGE